MNLVNSHSPLSDIELWNVTRQVMVRSYLMMHLLCEVNSFFALTLQKSRMDWHTYTRIT
jgi:hypothetical protein